MVINGSEVGSSGCVKVVQTIIVVVQLVVVVICHLISSLAD